MQHLFKILASNNVDPIIYYLSCGGAWANHFFLEKSFPLETASLQGKKMQKYWRRPVCADIPDIQQTAKKITVRKVDFDALLCRTHPLSPKIPNFSIAWQTNAKLTRMHCSVELIRCPQRFRISALHDKPMRNKRGCRKVTKHRLLSFRLRATCSRSVLQATEMFSTNQERNWSPKWFLKFSFKFDLGRTHTKTVFLAPQSGFVPSQSVNLE